MNELQAIVIGGLLLLTGMAIHIALTLPPPWTFVVAAVAGTLYYIVRVWFFLRIPGDLVIFIFEAMIATVVAYGFIIGYLLLV